MAHSEYFNNIVSHTIHCYVRCVDDQFARTFYASGSPAVRMSGELHEQCVHYCVHQMESGTSILRTNIFADYDEV